MVESSDENLAPKEQARLVPVFSADRMETEIVRSLLEDNGIQATIFGAGMGEYGSSLPGTTDRVMVRNRDVVAARKVIHEALDLRVDQAPDDVEQANNADDSYELEDFEDEDLEELESAAVELPIQVEILADRSYRGTHVPVFVFALLIVGAAGLLIYLSTR